MVYNWSIIEHNCLLCDERCEVSLCAALRGRSAVARRSVHSLRGPAAQPRAGLWRMPEATAQLRSRRSAPALRLPGGCADHPLQAPGTLAYGRLLGERLAHHLEHAFADGLPRPDLLLPVPLARRRLRQRGFNQRRCSPTG